MAKAGIVISLCDFTGNMVRPWAEAGYKCYCVDTQHSIRKERTEGNIHYVWGDVRSWTPPDGQIAFLSAFPPCTHVAVSGARDFATKGLKMLTDAMDIFNSCHFAGEYSGAPYFIENPVSTFSTYIRKPDFIWHPHQFAGYADDPDTEAYTKATCLWVGNGFVMPSFSPVKPWRKSMMHLIPPSPERANIRSATPQGFAKAVFIANGRSDG